jgi:putative transposase
MLECKKCQHDVVANWTIMEKYRRYWFDFTQKALFGSGLCQSLRNMSEEWSALLGNNVGLSTINQRINQIEVLIQQGQSQPLKDIPEIVQLDGIWISLQTEEEDVIIIDKKGRQRYHRRGQRKVVLVALGLWSDGSGRREILDWEVATSESEEAWLILLKRLVGRGLTVEGGLKGIIRDGGSGLGEAVVEVYGKAVVDQRCVFHKLKNVKEAISRGQSAEVKRELMGDAKAIYRCSTASEARAALAKFKEKWNERETKAVATLERDFEKTIAFYQLEGMSLELARTTSLLERTNRELRRKFRQVGSFGSEIGAKAAVYVQVSRLNGVWSEKGWWQVSQEITFEYLNLHP